jgi:hypothetical protein
MRALRFLALFGFCTLSAGCGTFCPPPGQPGAHNETGCTYNMLVTNVDKNNGDVTATISTRVEGDENTKYDKPYTFNVRNANRLVVGKEYVFFNADVGPTLEAFPNGADPKR